MDNLFELLPILIFILIPVIKALVKKKDEEQDESEPMIQDSVEIDMPDNNVLSSRPKKNKKKKREEAVISDNTQAQGKTQTTTTCTAEIKCKNSPIDLQSLFNNRNDLKKSVIMAEILGRKF